MKLSAKSPSNFFVFSQNINPDFRESFITNFRKAKKSSIEVLMVLCSIFRCDSKQECKMDVNSDVFGDPCPGTHKYVEVHFACAPRVLATTTKRPLPPWFLQGGADNLWNNPKLSPTSSSATALTTANSTPLKQEISTREKTEIENIYSISDTETIILQQTSSDLLARKPILVTSDSPTSTTPIRIPITTPRPTTTTTSTTTPSGTTTIESTTILTIEKSLIDKEEKDGMSDVITDIINEYEIERGQ